MQFQIVDWRFNWEESKIIICLKNLETNKHFYVHQYIETEQEADEIISAWELATTLFFDVPYQHPN